MPVQRGGDQAYTGPMQRTRSVVQGGMLGPDRDGESLSHPSSTSAGGDDRENIVVVPSAGAGSSSSFGGAQPQSSQQQQYAPAALAPQDTYSFGPAHASVPGTPVSDTPSFLLGPSAAPPPPPPLPERSGSAGILLSARSSSVRSQPPPPPPPPPPSAAPPLQSQRSFAQQATLVEVHHPPPAAAMTEARSVSPQGPPPPPSAAAPTSDSQQQQPQSSAPQRMGSLIRAFERPVEQEPGVYDDVSRSSSIQQPPGAAPPGKVLVKRRVSKPKLPTAMMSSDGGEALDLSPTTRPRTIPPPPPSAAVVAAVKPPPRVVKEPVVEDSALPKVDNVRAKIEEKEKERAKEKEAEELAEERYFSKKYKKPSDSLSPVRSSVATTDGKRLSTDAGSSSNNTAPLVLPATGGDLVQSPSHAMTKSASFSNGTTPRGVASAPPRSNATSAYTVTFSAVFGRQCDPDKFRKMSLNDRRNVIDAALAQSLFDAVSGPVANLSDVTVSMDVMDDEEEEGQWRGCLSMCGQIDHIASSADRRLVVRLLTCTFQNPDVFATAMHPLMGSPPPPSSNGTSSSSSSLCSLEQALINDVEVVGRNAPSTASLADSPPANAANKLGVIQPVQMSRQQAPEGGEGFGRSLSATSSEALRQYELRKRLVSSSYRGYVPMTTPCRDAVPAATDYQYHPTLTSEHPYPSQAAFQMIDRQQQSSLSAAAAARQTPDRYLQRSIYAKGTAPTVAAAAAAAPVASYAHLNNSSNAYATQQQYSQQYRNPSEESSLSFTPNLTSYRTRRYQTF